MNAKELRQAAILLHDWYCKPDDQITYGNNHPWFYMDEDATNADQTKAARLVKDHILATVQEDGEEKIDQKWLMECWGFRDDANWDSEDEDVELSLVDTGCYKCIEPEGMIIWCQETGLTLGRDGYTETIVQFPVSTRSQFRALCQGLGIEPLSKLVKPLDETQTGGK